MRMKAYPSFDAYFADQPAANQAIIRRLRAFVKRIAPDLEEAVKWGNGCWLSDDAPIAYVYAASDHTQFGFIAGAALDDTHGLLEGTGKWVRHVKLRKASDLDESALASLLRQAIGVGHPAHPKSKPRRGSPRTSRTRTR